MGCEGIYVRANNICVYFSQNKWSDEVKSALVSYISIFETSFSQRFFKVISLPAKDWNENWKETFKPVKIGNNIYISPPWNPHKASEDEIGIIINPQMAFGTGHHESTQLVIERMGSYLRPGMEVLDVGTGCGSRAIAAKKMHAAHVLGIDNDLTAIKNAIENKMLNDINGQLRFMLAELNELQPFEYDIVVANINLPVISELSTFFPKYLKPDGVLILSGILLHDENGLIKKMVDAGFIVVEKGSKKEWLVMVFKLKVSDARGD
jgi:ribosomal protein L11 methyltransferase